MSAHAVAQKDSLHRSVRLVTTREGFKAIYLDSTLSTTAIINKRLEIISARFYQIRDTLLTPLSFDLPGEYFYGSLRNSFSEKNRLKIEYFIRSNRYNNGMFSRIVYETSQLLSAVNPSDASKRDSIINDEYKRYIAYRLPQNVSSNGDSCFSKEEALINTGYDKKILNADSVIVVQSLDTYGTCAMGLLKEVILYKKDLGYIGLQYSLYKEPDRKISFQEASDLLDAAIKQTWGIIRFNKEQAHFIQSIHPL